VRFDATGRFFHFADRAISRSPVLIASIACDRPRPNFSPTFFIIFELLTRLAGTRCLRLQNSSAMSLLRSGCGVRPLRSRAARSLAPVLAFSELPGFWPYNLTHGSSGFSSSLPSYFPLLLAQLPAQLAIRRFPHELPKRFFGS